MSKEKRNKKYSILIRLLGLSCTLLLFGSLVFIIVAGFSVTSGILLATSVAGVVGPSIVVNDDSILDTVLGVFEIIIEGIQTILEVIFEVISSIFG